MGDKSIGEHAGILGAVVRSQIEFGQWIERRRRYAAYFERIEDMNVLTEPRAASLRALAAPARGDPRILALRVDDEGRAFVKQKVGNNERHALTGAASGDRHDMPIVIPADKTPPAAAEQEPAFVTPLPAGHFRGR